MNIFDVIIVGGGPCGLACGIEAEKNQLSYLILEKGAITESIRRYPVGMTFFSTSEMIEIGHIPFSSVNVRPTRAEALKYYRKVTAHFNLNIKLFTPVKNIRKEEKIFWIETDKETYRAKKVVIATGYYDLPKKINIPGEDLPHVSHYFDEAYKYTGTRVVVVGGANSAVETALDLYRNGAQVSLIHIFPTLDRTAKYWIVPDLENRIKKGEVEAFFNSEVKEILEDRVIFLNRTSGEGVELPANFVFLMTGYRPDANFLSKAGIRLHGEFFIPEFNPETFESNIEGIYLAGSIIGGEETARVFIENGREHGKHIIDHIKNNF